MQKWVVICWVSLALAAADMCPNGGKCEEGQTCCKSPTNGYDCCPFDEGECCGDHIHCCPKHTVCDMTTSSCGNATMSLRWVERVSAGLPTATKSFRMIRSYMGEDEDNICPDQSRCPAEFSCLKALTRYGCCPLAQGVSCPDGKHCCPEGHQCSLDSRSCVKKESITTVLCKDGVSECPEETTCCETPEGKWACCPMPKAVCCDDKIHCCPEETTCDVEHMKCLSSAEKALPMWAKFPARTRADWENQKEGKEVTASVVEANETKNSPDVTTANPVPPIQEESPVSSVAGEASAKDVPCNETTSCPDQTTCCKTEQGEWACCPLPEAVCCEDFIHCCPKGKTCNLAAQSCDGGEGSVSMLEKIPSFSKVSVKMQDVQCDDTAACPDQTTCCKTAEGGWACCPLPEAVCCEDFIHCCPKGKTCNLAAQSCDGGEGSVPMLEKIPSFSNVSVKMQDVQCDDTAACPDQTTCCKTAEGGWACCPLPEAVCCEDFIHCCPKGKTCNLAAQSCDGGEGSVPMLEKIPSFSKVSVKMQDVQCDGTAACPDQTTCCKTAEGDWACCPFPEAVCCEDFIHCCPKGKTCNLAAQSCDGGEGSVPMLEKIPSFSKVSVKMQDVQCDDTAACPDQTTCCKTAEGGWACCPLPEAVCCEDFIHCCPKGKTCNLAAQSCDGGEGSVSMLEKIPSFSKVSVKMQDVQCDSTAACPDQTTCCKTAEGGWACCPLPEAVCCEDFIHCCPKGKTCNLAAQSCDGGEGSVPMLEKIPSYLKQNVKMQNVSCDSSASCPDQTTCCKTTQGTWACCPLPEAVCCDDHEHCCPSGTTCDLATLSCLQSSGSVPMSKKMPALTWTSSALSQLMEMVVEEKTEETGEEENKVDERDEQKDFDDEEDKTDEEGNILCDSHTQCPQGTTCCFMQKFQKWGCCPLPKAVCCTDGEHCCPTDYKCKEESTSCVKGEVEIPWYTKIPATVSIQADSSFVQCGAVHQCPAHMSCCRLFTGEWGCCPLSNAVCCGDKEHCCPEGYTCDLTSRSCHKLLALELETVPLTPVFLPVDQSQRGPVKPILNRCDDVYSCNVDETCCRTSHTTWGCCLSPNAMCCRDMKHCCPDGYRCSRGGSCIKKPGLHWLNWHTFFSNKRKAIIV
ncbi:granulin a isoform X1 [Oryzias melastigma]|uniref:Granulin a n=1 Tax=Oryzias melastigma TaxID=30732 RepID=A0A3B3CG76_ORYME|nr:granulin a isoform X1 [Oryzias melastigma]